MVASAIATERLARPDLSAGELVLRVFGRIVRLKSHKCTIGAASHCTLRLRAQGLAPVHCLIVRGRAGAVVRRWAPHTLLNQRTFEDAVLCPGDRLGLGPVELEVLDVGAAAGHPAETESDDDSTRFAELEARRRSLEEERRQWQAEQEETKRAWDERLAQFTADLAGLDARQKALAEEQDRLNTAGDALADERRMWEAERDRAAALASAQTERLQTQLADLDSQREALDRRQREWQAEQEDSRIKLDERLAQLNAEKAELDALRNSLADEQNALQAERNAWADERRQWESDWEQRRVAESLRQTASAPDIEPQTDDSAAQPAAESAPSPESPELAFQPPDEKAPVDLAEVFRRIRAEIEAPEEKAVAAAPEKEPVAPTAKTTEEEESIDDYMSRLMQRVQTASGSAAGSPYSPAAPAPAARRAKPSAAPAVEPAGPQPASVATAQPESSPERVLPRAVAPEKRLDFSAMRELANVTAHNAITRYTRRVLISSMYSKLLVALVALAAAGSMLWLWKTATGLQITFYAGLAALLVAIYWGMEYALVSGRLRINQSGHIEWQSAAGGGKAGTGGTANNAGQSAREAGSDSPIPNPESRIPR